MVNTSRRVRQADATLPAAHLFIMLVQHPGESKGRFAGDAGLVLEPVTQ